MRGSSPRMRSAIAAMVVNVLVGERRDRLAAEAEAAEAETPPVAAQDAPAET